MIDEVECAAAPRRRGEPCFLLDPSLFTLPYDLAVCDTLVRVGFQPTLIGRSQRRGERASVDILRPCFADPLASLGYSSVLRKAAKAALYPIGWVSALQLIRPSGSVLNVQWMPVPLADTWVLSSLRRRHPLLYTAHDTMMGNASAGVERTVAQIRRLDPDLIIVHTRQGLGRLVDGGIEEGKLFLMSHPPLSLPREPKDADQYSTGAGKSYELAMIGEVKAYKGFEIAFRALAALPEPVAQRIRLRVAGRPFFDVERLRDETLPASRRAMVRLDLRYLSDEEFARTLDDSDCILLPYLEIEASGVFYAALSRAKMIIASDMGAFGEVLPQEFLIPVGDHTALAAKIARLIDDPMSRSQLADRLRQIAREQDINSAYETRLGEAFRRVKQLYFERIRSESD